MPGNQTGCRLEGGCGLCAWRSGLRKASWPRNWVSSGRHGRNLRRRRPAVRSRWPRSGGRRMRWVAIFPIRWCRARVRAPRGDAAVLRSDRRRLNSTKPMIAPVLPFRLRCRLYRLRHHRLYPLFQASRNCLWNCGEGGWIWSTVRDTRVYPTARKHGGRKGSLRQRGGEIAKYQTDLTCAASNPAFASRP